MKFKDVNNPSRYAWLWKTIVFVVAMVCIVTVLIVSGAVNTSEQQNTSQTSFKNSSASAITTTSKAEPPEPYKVASATILSTGDIMVHSPQLKGAKVAGKSEWDFSPFFKEVSSYFDKADFAVANLETTFAGNGSYTGYPTFNTPDSLIDAVKASGLDMVLSANNHCYDTGTKGFERTQKILIEKGIPYIGSRLTEDAPKYTVQDIEGVKVGMVAYTYETGRRNGLKTINGITVKEKDTNLLNSFSYSLLDEFYAEVDEIMSAMKADGAEATVFYLHWGDEYQTTENANQNKIAQALCDRGVDVIIGGHPHVIQPLELLTAKDGEHKTVCVYSLGNAVSNQRSENMKSSPNGNTEDGMLFYCTFDKYSDGKIVISNVNVVPTWVNKYSASSGYHYTIYPLENANDGTQKYGFKGTVAIKSKKSFERTKRIVAEGLTECQKAIGCKVTFAEK